MYPMCYGCETGYSRENGFKSFQKWDITISAGNSKIREYVFGYLQNDVEVPTINGEFPDCVLLGVLDLIPDPISSFSDPNIRMKSLNPNNECDKTETAAGAHIIDKQKIPAMTLQPDHQIFQTMQILKSLPTT